MLFPGILICDNGDHSLDVMFTFLKINLEKKQLHLLQTISFAMRTDDAEQKWLIDNWPYLLLMPFLNRHHNEFLMRNGF